MEPYTIRGFIFRGSNNGIIYGHSFNWINLVLIIFWYWLYVNPANKPTWIENLRMFLLKEDVFGIKVL